MQRLHPQSKQPEINNINHPPSSSSTISCPNNLITFPSRSPSFKTSQSSIHCDIRCDPTKRLKKLAEETISFVRCGDSNKNMTGAGSFSLENNENDGASHKMVTTKRGMQRRRHREKPLDKKTNRKKKNRSKKLQSNGKFSALFSFFLICVQLPLEVISVANCVFDRSSPSADLNPLNADCKLSGPISCSGTFNYPTPASVCVRNGAKIHIDGQGHSVFRDPAISSSTLFSLIVVRSSGVGSQLFMTNITLSGGKSEYGGLVGIFDKYSTFSCLDCILKDGRATSSGGAISIMGQDGINGLILKNTLLENNYATGTGPGQGTGGAIAVAYSGRAQIDHSTFQNNRGSAPGGSSGAAISVYRATIVMHGVSFKGNLGSNGKTDSIFFNQLFNGYACAVHATLCWTTDFFLETNGETPLLPFTLCGPGQYNPDGYSQIIPSDFDGCPKQCKLGKYATGWVYREADGCTECAAGTYCPAVDTVPVSCPGGTYNANTGASTSALCLDCPKGWRQLDNEFKFCLPCNPGDYQNIMGEKVCQKCNKNTFTNISGRSSCYSCSRGKEAERGSAKCTSCGAGESGTGIDGACAKCAAGQSRGSNDLTIASCTPCDPGSYQKEQGQAICLPCIPGTFNNKRGQILCEKCTVATYADEQNAEKCKICLSGKSSKNGSAFCQDCQPGRFSDMSRNIKECTICPQGWMQQNSASEFCTEMNPNAIRLGNGATSVVVPEGE